MNAATVIGPRSWTISIICKSVAGAAREPPLPAAILFSPERTPPGRRARRAVARDGRSAPCAARRRRRTRSRPTCRSRKESHRPGAAAERQAEAAGRVLFRRLLIGIGRTPATLVLFRLEIELFHRDGQRLFLLVPQHLDWNRGAR